MRTQKIGKEQTGNGQIGNEQIGKEQIGNGKIGNEHIPTLYTHFKLAQKGTVRVQSKFAGNEQMPTRK